MQDFANNIMGTSMLITVGSLVFGLVITVVILFFVWRTFLRPMQKGAQMTANLMASGVSAQARVLRLGETGMYINNQPVADVLLEVHPQGAQPFQAQTRMSISMLAL